ncbi:MAG TPA: hypothetical protein GX715_02380 [Armatimonadetes bacterium]|nr:hypothetical protein [Armatimonadota bacterium]
MSPASPIRLLAAHAVPSFLDALSRAAAARSDIELVGACRDWAHVTKMVRELRPDVLTLDAALPGMGGPAAVGELISAERQRVVVAATDGCGFASDVVACLEAGVVDFAFRRPEHSWTSPVFLAALFHRVRTAASVATESLSPCTVPDLMPLLKAHPGAVWGMLGDIGAPGTLLQVLPRLEPGFPGCLCIALSLPGAITRALAHYLDARCDYPVREVRPGDAPQPGTAVVLPGNYRVLLKPAYDGSPSFILEPRRPGDAVPVLDAALLSFIRHVPTHLVALSGCETEGMAGVQAVAESGGCVYTAPRESMLFTQFADGLRSRIAGTREIAPLVVCPVMPATREIVPIALARS